MLKEKRFLITTALEGTWLEDQPVLFLGEWCRLYSRKDRWSEMNAVVQTHHWDDREKFYTDYQYMNSFYERVLKDLSCKLNQIHGVGNSERYWRILVGPWLAYFIHILFDRWSSIESAVNNFEITNTVVQLGNEEALIPNDINQFAVLMVGDEWNHHIYAEVLRRLDSAPITFVNNKKHELNVKNEKVKASLKRYLALIYAAARYLARDTDAFLNSTYLPVFNELLLQLRLGQVPQLWGNVKPVNANLDWKQRDWAMSTQCQSEFEFFLLSMIPKQIPKVYLEGYQELVAQIQSLPWPKSPKLIYTSNVLWHDSVSMAYTAEKVEKGTQLICGQHGGGYGTARFHFAEEHEIDIADCYLTWGWRNPSKKSVVPLGITKVKKKQLSSSRDILLVITMNVWRYSFRLCAESAINYGKYIDRSFSFMHQLNKKVFAKTLVRLSPVETGINLPMRWHDRFPTVKVDDGNSSIYSLMYKSRIVVHTYNQTGFLETLAMGIPTVLLVDLNETPLRESAIPYYAELKRVGIFHDTPESAAAHVNTIWDDVDSWWTSIEVQGVVAKFTKQYCYRPDSIVESIETVIREVMAEHIIKN